MMRLFKYKSTPAIQLTEAIRMLFDLIWSSESGFLNFILLETNYILKHNYLGYQQYL